MFGSMHTLVRPGETKSWWVDADFTLWPARALKNRLFGHVGTSVSLKNFPASTTTICRPGTRLRKEIIFFTRNMQVRKVDGACRLGKRRLPHIWLQWARLWCWLRLHLILQQPSPRAPHAHDLCRFAHARWNEIGKVLASSPPLVTSKRRCEWKLPSKASVCLSLACVPLPVHPCYTGSGWENNPSVLHPQNPNPSEVVSTRYSLSLSGPAPT
jgi:hypothetical protein